MFDFKAYVVLSFHRFLPPVTFTHSVQESHCSLICHRAMLTHALALSASQFVHNKTSQRIYTSMHSAGLNLTELTYTRLEDNLVCHRGDRQKITRQSLGCIIDGAPHYTVQSLLGNTRSDVPNRSPDHEVVGHCSTITCWYFSKRECALQTITGRPPCQVWGNQLANHGAVTSPTTET